MPQYRYEAVDAAGVPIHGTLDAVDQTALEEQLTTRGLRLVSCEELSIASLIGSHRSALPRLFQLRIGEHLREALYSGLPAHEAVRAVAAEPLSHPIPGMVPWLWVMSWLIFGIALACSHFTDAFHGVVWGTGIFAIVLVPIIGGVVRWLYHGRPKQTLLNLADRLEAGEALPESLSHAVPREVRCVMESSVDDASKARVAADLIPNLLGGNLRVQQFLLTLIGPILLLGLIFIGLYSGLVFIVPKFAQIFADFGTDLPMMTKALVGMARAAERLGVTGWLSMVVLVFAAVIAIAFCFASGWGAELLEKIPVFGMAFRWAMQARVARILSSMVRNGCSYPESIRTATAGSGFFNVKQHGRILATELEERSGQTLPSRKLSGLPVSMLFVKDGNTSEKDRRAGIADTFQSLSEMLDVATLGQGQLFAVVIQFLVITITGMAVGFGVIALFLPLIKLLNDLS